MKWPFFIALTLVLASCERTSTDPSIAADAAADVGRVIPIEIRNENRVPGIETLFPIAARHLTPEDLATHAQLQRAAALALGNSSRAEANAKLEAVRAEQIRIILSTLGTETSAHLLRHVDAAIRDARRTLNFRKDRGQDVLRLQRMLKSASDLYNHARIAEAHGDHATALDHGSHAAGLVNSLRQLLAR